MCKAEQHEFLEIQYTSGEGYSATCLKCGTRFVFGYGTIPKFSKTVKKYYMPEVFYCERNILGGFNDRVDLSGKDSKTGE